MVSPVSACCNWMRQRSNKRTSATVVHKVPPLRQNICYSCTQSTSGSDRTSATVVHKVPASQNICYSCTQSTSLSEHLLQLYTKYQPLRTSATVVHKVPAAQTTSATVVHKVHLLQLYTKYICYSCTLNTSATVAH